jgi:hypothetical protein
MYVLFEKKIIIIVNMCYNTGRGMNGLARRRQNRAAAARSLFILAVSSRRRQEALGFARIFDGARF